MASESEIIGRNYLSPINKVATLIINSYEKLNRFLPKCMTISIELCGIGDISFSTMKPGHSL